MPPQKMVKKQLSFASFDVKNLIQPQSQTQTTAENSQTQLEEKEGMQSKKAPSVVDEESGGVSLSAV